MSTQKNLKKFQKIYDQTYNKTLKYAICKCNNLDDVDDIIQNTYMNFYKNLNNSKKISNYEAYIISIEKNEIIKHYKENARNNNISIFLESKDEEQDYILNLDAGIDIEADFIRKENIDQIWSYLKANKKDVARIFYLHFILDMTFSEISNELEINGATIKSSLYRTLKELKEKLGGESYEKK